MLLTVNKAHVKTSKSKTSKNVTKFCFVELNPILQTTKTVMLVCSTVQRSVQE